MFVGVVFVLWFGLGFVVLVVVFDVLYFVVISDV